MPRLPRPSRSVVRRPVSMGLLESRVMMSASQLGVFDAIKPDTDTPFIAGAGTTTASGSTSTTAASSPLSSVPALSSRPGATARIYLDFDGDTTATWGSYAPGTTPAYDTDGDASTFSDTELNNVRDIWARVAEKYAPFNVDVTTVNPGSFADRVAIHMVIGGSGAWLGAQAGGVAYVGAFTNSASNTGFIFDDNLGNGVPKYVAEATAHEAGHTFGLSHQASWSGSTLTAEYSSGNGVTAPIMGNSYSATRGLWWNGVTSASPTSYQDDLSVLSSSNNAFGYRADDFGSSVAAASTLSLNGTTVNPTAGVITTTADQDVFKFTTGAGTVNFTAAVPTLGAMLDAKLALLDSAGNTIAVADTSALGETLSANVAAGTYYVSVASHGSYGDLGTYTLTGNIVAPTTVTPTPLAAPTGLTATAASQTAVNLAWADNSADETGFAVQRSTDGGQTWTTVATVGATVTTYTDATVASTAYAYRVQAVDTAGARTSAYTNTATVTTPANPTPVVTTPAAPTSLTARGTSRSTVGLSWRDNATNETGFKVYMSTNGGGTWSLLGTVGANVTSVSVSGLRAGTTYAFKVTAYNAFGESAASNVASGKTTTSLFGAYFAPAVNSATLSGASAANKANTFATLPVARFNAVATAAATKAQSVLGDRASVFA